MRSAFRSVACWRHTRIRRATKRRQRAGEKTARVPVKILLRPARCFMAAILIVMWGQSFDSMAHAFRGAGVGDRRTLRSRSICPLLMGHFGPRRRVAHLIDKGRTQDSGSRIARGVRCPELG